MANRGDKRARKAEKRRKKLEQRAEGRRAVRPAEHWDSIFGAAVRFAYHHLSDRSGGDVVAFLARGRLQNGTRVLKAFLDASPHLDEQEVSTVRSWTALQPRLYERLELRGTVAVLRDLITWETVTAAAVSQTPLQALQDVRFAVGVILPTADGPVVGGELRGVREDATEQEVLAVAANLARRHWRLCQRAHPDVLGEMLRIEREAFETTFGDTWIEVEANELPSRLQTLSEAMPDVTVEGFVPQASMDLRGEDGRLHVLHDLRHGLVLQDRLDELLEAVRGQKASLVDVWLRDSSVSPAVFDAVHERHGADLDAVLSQLTGTSTSWPAERERLVQTHKPAFVRPIPHLFPVPEPVARAWSGQVPMDGLGMNALLGLEGA